MNLQLCIDDLLMRGCDDWEDACGVASVAIEVGGAATQDEIRDLSLELIRQVVQQGLMELGYVDVGGKVNNKGFQKWDLPVQEGQDQVEREWKALGRNPSLWEICWLRNTPKGDEIGERLLAERGTPPDGR